MTLIQFVRNHNDLSTDRGFQFEFFCDRCGSGYQSTFRGSSTNALNDALDVASGLFGGLFGNAADASRRMHRWPLRDALTRVFRRWTTRGDSQG